MTGTGQEGPSLQGADARSGRLSAAEALVTIVVIAFVGMVAYFDLVSGKVSSGNRGFATIVAAIFGYFVIRHSTRR